MTTAGNKWHLCWFENEGWEHLSMVPGSTMSVEPGNLSIYTGFLLRADARIRVQEPLRICPWCRSKANAVTSKLNIALSVLAFRPVLKQIIKEL